MCSFECGQCLLEYHCALVQSMLRCGESTPSSTTQTLPRGKGYVENHCIVLKRKSEIGEYLVLYGIRLCNSVVHTSSSPSPHTHTQPLKDWHLLLIVLVFVLVDVIILTPVSILESSRLAPRRVPDVEHPPSVNVCNNTL